MSNFPIRFDGSRLSGKIEGAWIALYSLEASLPAYFHITWYVSALVLFGEDRVITYFGRRQGGPVQMR